MNSTIFTVNWKDVGGAVVSGVIVAVLAYLSSVTDITSISAGQVLNVAVLAAIASLAKSFTTDSNGKLLGAFRVK